MDGKNRRVQELFVMAGGIALLFSAGCGAPMKMTAHTSGEKIFQAEKAFSDAREGNASRNAPNELAVAQGKLAAAKDAFAKENYDEATRMAEQTVADSEYARARATTRKTREIADEIKKETDVLRQEIQRMSN
jgi:hypothetical protein